MYRPSNRTDHRFTTTRRRREGERMRMRMRMSGYSARTLLFGLFRLLLFLSMDSSGSAGIGLGRVPDIRMAANIGFVCMMYVWALPPSPSTVSRCYY